MFSRTVLIGQFLYVLINANVKTFFCLLCRVSNFIKVTMEPSWTLGVWWKSVADFFLSFRLNLLTSTESFPVRDFPACAPLADNGKKKKKKSSSHPSEVPSCCDVLFPGSNCCELVYDSGAFILCLSPLGTSHIISPSRRRKPGRSWSDFSWEAERNDSGALTGASLSAAIMSRCGYAEKPQGARARTLQRQWMLVRNLPPERYPPSSDGSLRHLPQSLIANTTLLLLWGSRGILLTHLYCLFCFLFFSNLFVLRR